MLNSMSLRILTAISVLFTYFNTVMNIVVVLEIEILTLIPVPNFLLNLLSQLPHLYFDHITNYMQWKLYTF